MIELDRRKRKRHVKENEKFKKIGYVLGCNGYVGQALVNELIAQGVRVIGIGRSADSKFVAPKDLLRSRNSRTVTLMMDPTLL